METKTDRALAAEHLEGRTLMSELTEYVAAHIDRNVRAVTQAIVLNEPPDTSQQPVRIWYQVTYETY
ncbi:hypothetical protein MN2019_17865 [Mycolicibacterium neoaurum]|uniref:hypothetical protein n=1 Tax=Mycolicibacterium neoaurum TaxID=1795 RepID=UPI001BD0A153|nr:hypothetical protein [Mycolicibacterium neoaurum]QVI26169.1 hypothetical protein MN2019_17865 [Mycolicibacterium neoaurum]